MKIYYLLLLLFLFNSTTSSACSIFSCYKNGKMLVGSNEDGDYPFSYIRFVPSSHNRYGAIFFGASDMQAQSGVNEHGLFFDYSMLPEGEIEASKVKPLKPKNNNCSGYSDFLFSCKNVPEFLEMLKMKPYTILTSQLLIADAEGNSAIINAQDVITGKGNYQISTNFNSCKVEEGDYTCTRYDKIDKALYENDEISIDLFRNILDDVHVEGQVATQYSNIYDLKGGKIYMNLFHNYNETIILDVKMELEKGFRVQPLEEYFNEKNYMTIVSLKYHPEYYREKLVNAFAKLGYDQGIDFYKKLLQDYPEDKEKIIEGLQQVPFSLISRARIEHDNQPLFYYYNPTLHNCNTLWRSNNPLVKDASKLVRHLRQSDLLKETFGYFEDTGYIYMVLGEKSKALENYTKALSKVEENEQWRRQRVMNMLETLSSQP